nr:hypothetical protein [Tanacetum cinerariifolium]
MNITYPYTHNFGNMPSMYHIASLGLGKPYPKLDHHHMLMNHESIAAHGYPSVDYGRNVYDNNLNYSYFSFHEQQPLVKGGNNNTYLSFHQQKVLLQGGNNPYLSFHQQQGLVQCGMLSQFEPQVHDFHPIECLPRELAEDGASGVEVRVTLIRTEIIIKLIVCRACYGVLRIVVENGAKGARVVPPELAHEPWCSRTLLSTNDEGKRKYSKLAHEPLCSCKDILSIERQTRSGSFVFGSEETDHKKKRKRSKRKNVTSDDDDSHESHIEDRKEAKRICKEERKLKKEEKHRRREERRHIKASRRTAKLKLKVGGNFSPSLDLDKSHDSREEALSNPKKLEIKLREKAFESLRAKNGVGH